MRGISDNYLISEIKDDNRMAFTMIYEKYHADLYAFAYKYVREDAIAQDIVQHTFIRLWEVRKKLNPCLSIHGYIYKIAKNHTLNVIRNYNTAALKNMEYYRDNIEQEIPIEPGTEAPDLIVLLNRSIDKLSPQRVAICRMKIEDGLSNQEIAERLNISVNTVKNQYNTSIKQLRHLMGAGSTAIIVLLNILPYI